MVKIPNTKENSKRCICPNCPTYNECVVGKKEKLFCARGKTPCSPEKQGCICPECSVASEYGLEKTYYCHIGPEK
ncbi:hypothetical protein COT77_03165 [Candidatus Berkelbacteria bacterium CG10_big_fil_rev_8_21_14_0_10_41_12]|uniref:DUF2769 domain-containing protein n=1 Tax=Candidatus Berkelbacteria bacterium CG10_big_fil_rev_8_21_14_0_10_41_12 TaxID=1974513 RepID=A0A2M6WWH5_9BACT|nr:MAG: hypothetical protein COT77_03165 [Candidatus Berkelbacteria bacterium CG10_big_fil_rev_8_21_14_0_10_41_12]